MSEPTDDGVAGHALAAAPVAPVIRLEDPTSQQGVVVTELLTGHRQAEAIQQTEAVQIRAAESSVEHVEVFRVGGVRTPIIGRPRPLPHDRRAQRYTLNCEEPDQWMEFDRDTLEKAAAADVKVIARDHRIYFINWQPRERWRTIIALVLKEYADYPAVTGFLVQDEPLADRFADLGEVTRIMKELAPDMLPYINLLPTYAYGDDIQAYQQYLDSYVAQVHPLFLCFDNYPLFKAGPIRDDYFLNWALVRKKALQSGIPAWNTPLTVEHIGYKYPTESDLLWLVNTSLAYGCKGVTYFTYWVPADPIHQHAIIDLNGDTTSLYYAVQRVDNRWLSRAGKELLPLTSESVTHFGESPPPKGVEVFTSDAWVASASGSPVILSRFRSDQRSGRHGARWLLVVNRSLDSIARTTLTLQPPVHALFQFDPASERYVRVRTAQSQTGHTFTVTLDPGAANLYRL